MATVLHICQSCSMPLHSLDVYGTEADGSKNQEYCIHCYKDGAFTHPDRTLEQMVEIYAPLWGSWTGNPEITLEQAKVAIYAKLSPLKRWATQGCE